MNDLDFYLEVVYCHVNHCRIHHWISRKTLEIEPWESNGHVTTDRWRRRHVTPKGETRDPNMLRVQYLKNSWR